MLTQKSWVEGAFSMIGLWNLKLREGLCPGVPVTAASISNNTRLSWTLAETESATPFIRTMGWPLLHISNGLLPGTHKWHLHWFLHWPATTHIHNADVSSYPVHLCPELTIVVSFTILPPMQCIFMVPWNRNYVTCPQQTSISTQHWNYICFDGMFTRADVIACIYGYLRLGCPR